MQDPAQLLSENLLNACMAMLGAPLRVDVPKGGFTSPSIQSIPSEWHQQPSSSIRGRLSVSISFVPPNSDA
jgi:hypothetical protein